jgi:hypothetical protein
MKLKSIYALLFVLAAALAACGGSEADYEEEEAPVESISESTSAITSILGCSVDGCVVQSCNGGTCCAFYTEDCSRGAESLCNSSSTYKTGTSLCY